MALPVVMKSGKNYMTLVLDDEMEFPELLQHIVTKFVESEKFFGRAPFAVMIEGRELTDTQKCQMLDAIAEYSSVKISVLIENDKLHEYVAERAMTEEAAMDDGDIKVVEISEHNYDTEETSIENNCCMICRNVSAGEKINVEGSVVVYGNVASGAIIKAGGNIVVLGTLKGQAIAGCSLKYRNPYILAWDFKPENYRIGSILGERLGRSKFGLNKHYRGGAKVAQFVDGEIQIDKLYIKN